MPNSSIGGLPAATPATGGPIPTEQGGGPTTVKMTVTAAGAAIIEAANVAAQLTALGLAAAASAATVSTLVKRDSAGRTKMVDPAVSDDVATKNYVDAVATGLEARDVRLASAAALPANTYANGVAGVGATLTASANGALTMDGTAVAVGDRILVKDEAAPANNGIYIVTATGIVAVAPYILTRALDMDTPAEFNGILIFVNTGTANMGTAWVSTAASPFTVGTTSCTFIAFNPTVADASIVNAKLANMANATVKGRNTAGTGVPEDVTMSQLRTLLALALANISDAGTVASLASDTDGTLAANSDSKVATQKAVKTYVAAHGGGDFLAPLTNAESAITGTASPTTFDTVYKCTGTSADYTVTLPAVSGNSGKFMCFRGGTSAELTKVVTIDGNGSEKIQTARLSIALLWDEFLVLYCDGTQWWIVGHAHADWQAFTPTINASSVNPGKGATRIETCYWRRIGHEMEIHFWYEQTSAGTSGTGTYLFPIPAGFVADTSITPAGGFTSNSDVPSCVGVGNLWGNGLSQLGLTVTLNDSTDFILQQSNTTTYVAATNYGLNLSHVNYSFTALIPISGW